MLKMGTKLELKDSLYYADLIYEIESLAGFNVDADFEVWQRITERKKDIRVKETVNDGLFIGYTLSPFQQELFEIVSEISKKVGSSFGGLEEISKYPLHVQDVLTDLEKKKMENEMLNHLNLIVKNMGLEYALCLGESRDQSICLNKRDNLWEVYIIEGGISFEKSSFEDCFDACLEVINLLADSKQMYEKAKENFVLVRKLG